MISRVQEALLLPSSALEVVEIWIFGSLEGVIYPCNITGDLIPGSSGHTLLSSLSSNFFDA